MQKGKLLQSLFHLKVELCTNSLLLFFKSISEQMMVLAGVLPIIILICSP